MQEFQCSFAVLKRKPGDYSQCCDRERFSNNHDGTNNPADPSFYTFRRLRALPHRCLEHLQIQLVNSNVPVIVRCSATIQNECELTLRIIDNAVSNESQDSCCIYEQIVGLFRQVRHVTF